MKKLILAVTLLCGLLAVPVQAIRATDPYVNTCRGLWSSKMVRAVTDTSIILLPEDDVKAALVLLALHNPEAVAADARIHMAEIARRKAGGSFLSSVSLAGNVNEFVINNSPAANFFPKYNFGMTIPLDIFSRSKAEKKTADEMISMTTFQKAMLNDALKAKVLTKYEIYKEKKALLALQRIITDDDAAAYDKAQKDYKADAITIEEVNRAYRDMLASRVLLVSREKDFNVAVIEIEEIIGVPLKTVLEKRQN